MERGEDGLQVGGAVLARAVVRRLGQGGELEVVGVGGVEPFAALGRTLQGEVLQRGGEGHRAGHDVALKCYGVPAQAGVRVDGDVAGLRGLAQGVAVRGDVAQHGADLNDEGGCLEQLRGARIAPVAQPPGVGGGVKGHAVGGAEVLNDGDAVGLCKARNLLRCLRRPTRAAGEEQGALGAG